MADAAGALWRFSLDFYQRPGVAEALLALQDRRGLDVNLILYALWYGVSGRGRLDPAALQAADRLVAALRDAAVVPLRELRRRLKSDPAADVQALRGKVKELELAAEEAAQRRLAVAASPPDPTRGRAARREDALYNLDLQVGAAVGTQAIRRAVEALPKNS